MRDPNLRASDADRERVADLLRVHCGEGRLTMEEFHSRLDACFEARTYGDLDALVADLPGRGPYEDLPVPASETRGGSSRLPAELTGSPWRGALTPYLTANIICWMIWLISGDSGGVPWPVWVSGPWGAVLLGRAVAGWDGDADRGR